MTISAMRKKIDSYLGSEALFATHVQQRRDKWVLHYVKPLSEAYGGALKQLNEAVAQGEAAKGAADASAKALQDQIGTATALVFGLLGPFAEAAGAGLKKSLSVSDLDVYNRTMKKAWDQVGTSNIKPFETLLEGELIRQSMLNYVTDRGVALIKSGATIDTKIPQQASNLHLLARRSFGADSGAKASAKPVNQKNALGVSSKIHIPGSLLSGLYSQATFRDGVADIFLGGKVELCDAWEEINSIGADEETKRGWLDMATQTVMLRPPDKPLDTYVPPIVLKNLFLQILISTWLLRIGATGGQAFPRVSNAYVAREINLALDSAGGGFILNNYDKPWRRGATDPGVQWNGMMMNGHRKKIREIGENATKSLGVYMKHIAENGIVV